jgi:DNA (cytosine-5)-methyltransferase 1
MRHGSLFSGIGGFDLAAEWMGWENVFHCEMNEFGKKVLKHYWPQSISYHDITKTDFTIHRGRIDILTGGFPCQPYSLAGKRLGKEDNRHLWPEMLRAIREIQPTWVVGENVFGLVNWDGGLVFDEVQTDLEAQGYQVQPYVLPACAVNAPHRRDRVWFVAYRDSFRLQQRKDSGKVGKGQENVGRQRSELTNAAKANGKIKTTPNASSDGLNDKSTSENNSIGQNNKQSGTQWQRTSKRLSDEQTSTHAESQSSEWLRPQQRELSKQEKGQFGGNGGAVGHSGHAADSKRIRSPREEHRQEESGLNTEKNQGIGWANFPTQSPICVGNDGIPERLDFITFPKWRNESIKAAGNAVVPQVVYQIFKAIEEYDRNRS